MTAPAAFKADIEPLSACLRVFPADARPGVDPYLFSASVVWVDKHTVELKGVKMDEGNWLSITARRAVFDALRSMGVTHFRMRRVRPDGREKVVTLAIDRNNPGDGDAENRQRTRDADRR